MQYIDRLLAEDFYTLSSYPDSLAKKITLLTYFRSYMSEHLLKVSELQEYTHAHVYHLVYSTYYACVDRLEGRQANDHWRMGPGSPILELGSEPDRLLCCTCPMEHFRCVLGTRNKCLSAKIPSFCTLA